MANIKMFRLITGEDIIAELKDGVYINVVQLMIVPSKTNPQDVNYGFAPFPSYARPKSDKKLYINENHIVYWVDIEEDFLEQYNMVFNHVVAPTPQIFTGN